MIHAVDHVVRLVEGLPSPAELSRKGYSADPRLSACFASADHLTEVVNADRALSDFLASTDAGVAERIIALLVTVKQERKVLGVALEGEILKRDVPQITVSFANHRVVDPATTYEETRRLLKRRAFDHLLGIALGRIAPARRARDNALEIGLEELHSARGRSAILLPVVVPRSELRPRTDLLAEAQRYLA